MLFFLQYKIIKVSGLDEFILKVGCKYKRNTAEVTATNAFTSAKLNKTVAFTPSIHHCSTQRSRVSMRTDYSEHADRGPLSLR